MFGLLITLVTTAVLAGASLRASTRYRTIDRLPMQWSLTGRVIWSAPRGVALFLTPVLAALIMGAVTILTLRSPEDGEALTALVVMALSFAFAHALHLKLISRSFYRR